MNLFDENSIVVHPINTEKLRALLTRLLKDQIPTHNIITASDGIIELKEMDGFLLINTDCCYQESDTQLHKRTGKWDISEYFRISNALENIEVDEKNVTHKKTLKRFTFTMHCQELIKNYCHPTLTLKQYMGRRFNYNPRVTTNMRELIKAINDCYNEQEVA